MKAKKKSLAPSSEVLPSSEALAKVVERQMEMLRAYRSRQDDIVRGLGGIQKLLGLGAHEAAVTAIADLLARDLKQAKDRQDNHAFALDIAIKAIEQSRFSADTTTLHLAMTDALSQIELLVPEAFPKSGVTVAASGAS